MIRRILRALVERLLPVPEADASGAPPEVLEMQTTPEVRQVADAVGESLAATTERRGAVAQTIVEGDVLARLLDLDQAMARAQMTGRGAALLSEQVERSRIMAAMRIRLLARGSA